MEGGDQNEAHMEIMGWGKGVGKGVETGDEPVPPE